MSTPRSIKNSYTSVPTTEGAGVSLKRAFGYFEAPLFDPFLLFDDFRSTREESFIKGFPWHPHRGIETITYVLQGDVEHGDSLGNKGTISSGDIQWMTAGSGIIHQEMPKGDGKGTMLGFQLWLNLPAKNKMCQPKYRDIKSSDIPTIQPENGVKIKVICGTIHNTVGPINNLFTNPNYLDISLEPNTSYKLKTEHSHMAACYIFDGQSSFSKTDKSSSYTMYNNETLLLFEDGDYIEITTVEKPVRFLFISGKPLKEPISWRGPVVMNSDEEITQAFAELDEGTFIKKKE